MSNMNILLVEDSETAIETCQEYAEQYTKEGKNISVIVAKNLSEAFEKLQQNIDVAIVDIKLANNEDGNDVLAKMQDLCLRIPTVIHTGTPDEVRIENTLKTFKRGEGYAKIFKFLLDVYNTGIVNILGKKGVLEKKLSEVYSRNIQPVISNSWINYGKINSEQTEKALLRYTLNHLMQLLENTDDIEKCYPEEMYIYPPIDENYRTGSIVKDNENHYFIILSPACDLALHNGSFKTERVLLVEIKDTSSIIALATKHCTTSEERKEKMESIFKNTFSLYYHWLPKVDFYSGGIINFRRINSLAKKELQKNYSKPVIQIAPFFCKDIVARFSSYYARQGQPDIDYENFINEANSETSEIGDEK